MTSPSPLMAQCLLLLLAPNHPLPQEASHLPQEASPLLLVVEAASEDHQETLQSLVLLLRTTSQPLLVPLMTLKWATISNRDLLELVVMTETRVALLNMTKNSKVTSLVVLPEMPLIPFVVVETCSSLSLMSTTQSQKPQQEESWPIQSKQVQPSSAWKWKLRVFRDPLSSPSLQPSFFWPCLYISDLFLDLADSTIFIYVTR